MLLPLSLLACADPEIDGIVTPDEELAPASDTTPPAVDHDGIDDALPWGQDIAVDAVVVDDDAVFVVELFYKNEDSGEGDWKDVAMRKGEDKLGQAGAGH